MKAAWEELFKKNLEDHIAKAHSAQNVNQKLSPANIAYNQDDVNNDYRYSVMSAGLNIGHGTMQAVRDFAQGKDSIIENEYGRIEYNFGTPGHITPSGKVKRGYGFLHVVYSRMVKDGVSLADAVDTAIMVADAIETGRETLTIKNKKYFRKGDIEGIFADNGNGKLVLTGYKLIADGAKGASLVSSALRTIPPPRKEEVVAAVNDWVKNHPTPPNISNSASDINQKLSPADIAYNQDDVNNDYCYSVMSAGLNIGHGTMQAVRDFAQGKDAVIENEYGRIVYDFGKPGQIMPSGKIKHGHGLLHIVYSRMAKDGQSLLEAIETAIKVGDAIERGVIQGKQGNKTSFQKDGYEGIVAKNYDGSLVVTGYKIEAGVLGGDKLVPPELRTLPLPRKEDVVAALNDWVKNHPTPPNISNSASDVNQKLSPADIAYNQDDVNNDYRYSIVSDRKTIDFAEGDGRYSTSTEEMVSRIPLY